MLHAQILTRSEPADTQSGPAASPRVGTESPRGCKWDVLQLSSYFLFRVAASKSKPGSGGGYNTQQQQTELSCESIRKCFKSYQKESEYDLSITQVL